MEKVNVSQAKVETSPMDSVMNTIAKSGGFDNAESMLSRIAREQALGSKDSLFNDILRGINRATQGFSIPNNTDMQGLTFFTRPNLNLSYDNIAQVRTLTALMSREPNSYARVIRTLLDRKLASTGITTNLVDDKLTFIALLTNSVVSCTGWPDLMLNTYATSEGMAREVWMMNDKLIDHYEMFTLNVNFQNMLGDPITLLFFSWIVYIGSVYTNKMLPHIESLLDNEIDYMTRIYRLVLDYSGTYVQKWAATGAAFPTAINIGQHFNFDRSTPYTEDLAQIQIPFSCVGAMYNDPIVLDEFNKAQILANPKMAFPQDHYKKLAAGERALFNFHGYPRINLDTNELEWWVDKEVYNEYRKGSLGSTNKAANPNMA